MALPNTNKPDYLILLLIAVAFYLVFIPHHNYPYPVHIDELMHLLVPMTSGILIGRRGESHK